MLHHKEKYTELKTSISVRLLLSHSHRIHPDTTFIVNISIQTSIKFYELTHALRNRGRKKYTPVLTY